MACYTIKKVITNNLVRAIDSLSNEVILAGKGIGFKRKTNDLLPENYVEKVYVLSDEKERKNYDELVQTVSPQLVEFTNHIISYIQSNYTQKLNEHIHIALTDHIGFMLKRIKMGIVFENPVDFEAETLYPKETKIARRIVEMIESELHIEVPKGEVFLIAMHIMSAVSNQSLSRLRQMADIINTLISVIEIDTNSYINRNDLNYSRLCIHLRFLLERLERGEELVLPEEIKKTIKREYPDCYNLSYKLSRIIQQNLHKNVKENEVICLSIHLYRFIPKNKMDNREGDET